MDDSTESKVLQDAVAAHIKILFKLTSKALSSEKLSQNYSKCSIFLSRELLLAILAFFILMLYRKQIQTVQNIFVYVRRVCVLSRIEAIGLAISTNVSSSSEGFATNEVWEAKGKKSACFALRGRRPRMEDRFTMIDSISDAEDIGIYAIYDGHGGEFAAEFIQKRLVERIKKKIGAVRRHIDTNSFHSTEPLIGLHHQQSCEGNKDKSLQPCCEGNSKDSEKKLESAEKGQVNKLNQSLLDKKEESARELLKKSSSHKRYTSGTQVSLAQIIQDEIMALDLALIEAAKKTSNIAGTTLLVALLDRPLRKLVVANVGDSRGIMCDLKGKVIPLSFDHKPQQLKEHKRIKEAGGFISFNGVWRVAGILATSRALGDYPLKDRNLVTADPDILTFDLLDHQPKFIMLASDGLWDAFSNEEAASYISSRLDEPLMGAKSIAHQCLSRGSLDNVTVLVVDFR